MQILLYFLLTVHVILSALMILVTLMQRPRSEGLGAAFGGGMTDNIFGAQTTNVLAKFTTWLGGSFFVITLALAMLYARAGHSGNNTDIQRQISEIGAADAAAAEASPAPADATPTTVTPAAAAAAVAAPAGTSGEATVDSARGTEEANTSAEEAATAEPAPAPAEPVLNAPSEATAAPEVTTPEADATEISDPATEVTGTSAENLSPLTVQPEQTPVAPAE
ncbi:MAG: preprotein translocase subunit SecG [Chthoniobacterales bacterium]